MLTSGWVSVQRGPEMGRNNIVSWATRARFSAYPAAPLCPMLRALPHLELWTSRLATGSVPSSRGLGASSEMAFSLDRVRCRSTDTRLATRDTWLSEAHLQPRRRAGGPYRTRKNRSDNMFFGTRCTHAATCAPGHAVLSVSREHRKAGGKSSGRDHGITRAITRCYSEKHSGRGG